MILEYAPANAYIVQDCWRVGRAAEYSVRGSRQQHVEIGVRGIRTGADCNGGGGVKMCGSLGSEAHIGGGIVK
jgi:hypothetical protein